MRGGGGNVDAGAGEPFDGGGVCDAEEMLEGEDGGDVEEG